MRTMRSASGCAKPVASLAFAPAAQRRAMQKAMVHMAYSTPAQFSSFYGAKMLLPECYMRRAKLTISNMLRKPPQMSFLGVGAPEAILVGIVALVVFGPKGLADAAKSLGSTLRSFQPAIKEVVQVSQELKGTLDKELGLNEFREAARPTPRAPEYQPITEDAVKAIDPDIELKRAEAAKAAWGAVPEVPAAAAGAAAAVEAAPAAAPAAPAAASAASSAHASSAEAPASPSKAAPASETKDLSAMSMADLEAELARRKASSSGKA